MTFEEIKEEVERIKIKSEKTDLRLEVLEAYYDRLEREVIYLENRLHQEL